MASGGLFWIFGALVLGLAIGRVASKCDFPAIYSFGDSHADTGGISAALGPVLPPDGETFFKKPVGRYSDGRLMIDFIAEYLGLPYLSAYLDSIGTNFSHGANFASAGATIHPAATTQPDRYSPFYLEKQVNQFIQFKARTTELYNKNLNNCGALPKPSDFSKALYTIDIGYNDLALGFGNFSSEDQVRAIIPGVLDQFAQAIQRLYGEGARAFLVNNVGPIGCAPFGIVFFPPKNATRDKNQCAVAQNEVIQAFNKQFKDRVVQLRAQLPLATITLVDTFTLKYSLINNATNQGFDKPWNFCCGSLQPFLFCGAFPVNASYVCNDPWRRISWDGIHNTEAANRWFVNKIVGGLVSDPPVPINQACPWNN